MSTKENKETLIMLMDPFYWYLKFALRHLYKAQLKIEERIFIVHNINKHRLVQWINLAGAFLVFSAIQSVTFEKIDTVITALIAPVMIMGTAWFSVSFGSIPERFIDFSIEITFWLYMAFKLSLTTMFLAISVVSPNLLWPVLALIYIAVDFSCAQYDTCDGLKAGLDDVLLKHSRAALIYYQDQGIDIDKVSKVTK